MKAVKSEIHHVGLTVAAMQLQKQFMAECLDMHVLSDSQRAGDWIDTVTGLKKFKARNVYISPDHLNFLEMFHIFSPPLYKIPMAFGSSLGISHLCITIPGFHVFRDTLKKWRLPLHTPWSESAEKRLLFQDPSSIFWEIAISDFKDASEAPSVDQSILSTCLRVSDLNRAIDFYSELFKLNPGEQSRRETFIQNTEQHWFRAEETICPVSSDTNQTLLLCQLQKNQARANPKTKINCLGCHHIAFKVANARDHFARIQSRGYECISPPLQIPMGPNRGGWLFYFWDADGTIIEILQSPSPGKNTND